MKQPLRPLRSCLPRFVAHWAPRVILVILALFLVDALVVAIASLERDVSTRFPALEQSQ